MITTTKIWNIDESLVVADSLIEAIQVLRSFNGLDEDPDKTEKVGPAIIEKTLKKWTIEDAKPGDIVYTGNEIGFLLQILWCWNQSSKYILWFVFRRIL